MTKVLEERISKINGRLVVVKGLGLGTCIKVEGLTQSGGVVELVWKTTLRRVHKAKKMVNRCLILGLGGGSAAKWLRKLWPKAKITGVEIDPLMVSLGKKYLNLNNYDVDVKITDALSYLNSILDIPHSKFDLVLVDLYLGYEVPRKFTTDKFLRLVLKFLTDNGVAVFNRLYFDEKRKEAEVFHCKLIQAFKKVCPFYPEANVMYLCEK